MNFRIISENAKKKFVPLSESIKALKNVNMKLIDNSVLTSFMMPEN